ncbi:MAG: hypothetical protein U1F65_06940 [Verrucomicrobiota bacterium]
MKIFALTSAVAWLIQFSCFAQGYMALGGPGRGVWDGFSQPLSKLGATMDVAIYWGTGTPAVGSIASSIPTNTAAAVSFSRPAAWNLILNDANFHLAVDANTSQAIIPAVAANGPWAYTTTGGFSNIPIQGTTANTSYTLYVVGWDKTYSTPAAAGAAGAAVGWSAPFSYTAVDSISTPASFVSSGFLPFGVVPEPGTFSIVSLGAVLAFWRRHGGK